MLGATLAIALLIQIIVEIIQSAKTALWDYVTNFNNYTDIFTYLTCVYLLTVHSLQIDGGIPIQEQRIIAAVSLLLTWIKVFEWFKLFKKTSFYIKLVIETFNDIRYFIIIFAAVLITIGCAMYMLQLNKASDA